MTTARRKNFFERHRKKTLAVVVVTSILAMDVVAAAILGALGLYTPPRKVEQYYRIRHPVYHHTLASNIRYSDAVWGRIGYRVNTNSLGFKDCSAREVPLESDGKRVLVIGDSFAEGVGIPYEETFAGVLAERLKKSEVEILNAAVTSYCPIIYWRKIDHLLNEIGLRVDHVLVFIDLSDVKDESNYSLDEHGNVVSRKDVELDERLQDFITEHTILLGNLRVLVRNLRRKMTPAPTIDDVLNLERSLWTVDPEVYAAYGEAGLGLAEKNMDKLKRMLDARGVRLTIAVYPWPDQIVHRDLESRHVTFWRAWAERSGSGFVNFFPYFVDGADPLQVIEKYFITGDFHWNARGHRLIADKLLENLPLDEDTP